MTVPVSEGCEHSWQFPDWLPVEGKLCEKCGEPFHKPGGLINGVSFNQLLEDDPELVHWVRGLAMIRAVEYLAMLPESDPDHVGKRAAGNEQYRLATMLGWTERAKRRAATE